MPEYHQQFYPVGSSDPTATLRPAAPEATRASSRSREGTRLRALDGVRGVAILLVMLCHFVQHGGMRPTVMMDRAAHALAMSGWIGVDLFFVLSGFLITRILLQSKGARHYFKNFYVRRTLRIVPLFCAVCTVAFVVVPRLVEPSAGFRVLLSQQVWYWSYLANVVIAVNGWPAVTGSVGHFWSLAVEEQFYLVWPTVILLFRREVLARVVLGMIVTSCGFRILLAHSGHPVAAYVLTPARMDVLAVGALVAILATGPPGALAAVRRWAVPVFIVALGGVLGIFIRYNGLHAESFVMQAAGYSLLAILFGSFLVVVLTSPGTRLERCLESRTLVAFGRYSYALYLFHLPVAAILGTHVMSARSLPAIAGSQLPGQLVFLLIATLITYVLAWLSWHCYEVHFLNLKRLFAYGPDHTVSAPAHLARQRIQGACAAVAVDPEPVSPSRGRCL